MAYPGSAPRWGALLMVIGAACSCSETWKDPAWSSDADTSKEVLVLPLAISADEVLTEDARTRLFFSSTVVDGLADSLCDHVRKEREDLRIKCYSELPRDEGLRASLVRLRRAFAADQPISDPGFWANLARRTGTEMFLVPRPESVTTRQDLGFSKGKPGQWVTSSSRIGNTIYTTHYYAPPTPSTYSPTTKKKVCATLSLFHARLAREVWRSSTCESDSASSSQAPAGDKLFAEILADLSDSLP